VLTGEKVLGTTATAADGNGLQPDHAYTVAVPSISAAGELPNPVVVGASSDRQSPMRNAVLFDNFEEAAPGPMNPNYDRVRPIAAGRLLAMSWAFLCAAPPRRCAPLSMRPVP
jgi:hypothetical protein